MSQILENHVLSLLISIYLVSLISFFCFTKILGKELTVPIAFTSLALFALARGPMNSLPSQITSLLETYVSVQRLEAYFAEEEVESWVSGLRPDTDGPRISTTVGIENGIFRYQATPPKTSTSIPIVATGAIAATETTTLIDGEAVEEVKDAFELNVSVDFPIGKLSIIFGPTGSGKTSLFLALLGG